MSAAAWLRDDLDAMNVGARLASDIARRAKSNLALALAVLPPERRRDMRVLYAFCRLVDDIAEDSTLPVAQRQAALDEWRRALGLGHAGGNALVAEVLELPKRHEFPVEWLIEIVDGVASDLRPALFEDWDELLAYCRPVASVVGMCSARIFGCRSAQSEAYAVELGYALQLTNILRDVGEDARDLGRVYLPLRLLAEHGLAVDEVLKGVDDWRMRAVFMALQRRANSHYQRARALLPLAEEGCLAASRMMTAVYQALLERIVAEQFPVMRRRVRLPLWQKVGILLKYQACSRFALPTDLID